MLTLFKALILSRLDHGSQLWSPHKLCQISMIWWFKGPLQNITGLHDLTYPERLKTLLLYSVQRRCERYSIICLENYFVHNLSPPITYSVSDRRGRYCITTHVNAGHAGTLAFNSFRWRSIRLFNALPMYLRNTQSCSIKFNSFKNKLDFFIKDITNHPCQPGYNNSMDTGDCYTWQSHCDGLAVN